jgi:hypothetical protein
MNAAAKQRGPAAGFPDRTIKKAGRLSRPVFP